MTDYTKLTNFSVKDTLASGNPAKVIRGAEFDAEFNNIETAVNSKADEAELATETANRQAADQALQDAIDASGNAVTDGSVNIVANSVTSNNQVVAKSGQPSDVAGYSFSGAPNSGVFNSFSNEDVDIRVGNNLVTNFSQSSISMNPNTKFNNGIRLLGGDLELFGGRITGVDNVVASDDAASKGYVDAADTTLQSNIDLKADIDNPVFTGNVGIGTSNPTAKLDVKGIEFAPNQSAFYQFGTGRADGLGCFRITTALDNNGNAQVRLGTPNLTGAAGFIAFDCDAAERMRLTSSGDLNVGTTGFVTQHDSRVNIVSEDKLNKSALQFDVVNGNQTDFQPTIAFNHAANLNLDNCGAFIGAVAKSSTRFSPDLVFGRSLNNNGDKTEHMRLTSDGYLKADPSGSYLTTIGTNAVELAGHFLTADIDTVAVFLQNLSSNSNARVIDTRLPSGASGRHFLSFTGNSQVFQVLTSGTVLNATGTYGQQSDIKLKENITDATDKLDDIAALRFVNFDLKDNPDLGKQFGVIAQEIEEVFPSLVINTPDTKEVETTDEEGNTVTETVETGTVTKSVKYSVLTLMAVKALQELKAEKDELAVEHESLKDQVRLLTERIEAIEANN